MVTWPTMQTINFILLHAYFIFCTNYLLENRIELCIAIHDRCMYRKKWHEVRVSSYIISWMKHDKLIIVKMAFVCFYYFL